MRSGWILDLATSGTEPPSPADGGRLRRERPPQ